MFDAARAALLVADVPVRADIGRTHSGLISAFSLHLVKSGRFPVEAGRFLKHVEEVRLRADYSGELVEVDVAEEIVAQAEAFLAAIRAEFGL